MSEEEMSTDCLSADRLEDSFIMVFKVVDPSIGLLEISQTKLFCKAFINSGEEESISALQ